MSDITSEEKGEIVEAITPETDFSNRDEENNKETTEDSKLQGVEDVSDVHNVENSWVLQNMEELKENTPEPEEKTSDSIESTNNTAEEEPENVALVEIEPEVEFDIADVVVNPIIVDDVIEDTEEKVALVCDVSEIKEEDSNQNVETIN